MELDTFTTDSALGTNPSATASAITRPKPSATHPKSRKLYQHETPSPLSPQSQKQELHNGEIALNTVEHNNQEGNSASQLSTVSSPPTRTREQKMAGHIQFAALCWTLFLAGWNDGTAGPLLPRIQSVYGVNFTLVSLIFVFACLGFLSGALMNIHLTERIGFGKAMAFGSLCQIAGYSIQCSAPPFPVFIMAYFIHGIGIALQDAQANGFVATLSDNPETKMGLLHATYGLGAFAAPLVATQFSQMRRWSFHFLVSLGMAVVNTIILVVVFKMRTQDECLSEAGEVIPERAAAQQDQNQADATFKAVLHSRSVHLLAFFILIYVGVEVTLGGWIVTFIIDVRGGGPSAGYISSGFFGGETACLTVGRVALLWVNKKVGERRVLMIYAALCIALEFVIWFVPSLIGNAIAVSIVGVLLGPMYPIVMNQTSRILPRWILTGSIGWIAGFGQAGSALFPFVTGAVAQKHGIKSLQPLLVTMMACMIGLWLLIPRETIRAD